MREQLAAPVAAHGDQGAGVGHPLVLPEQDERLVDGARQLRDQQVDVGVLLELREQVRALGLQDVARRRGGSGGSSGMHALSVNGTTTGAVRSLFH